MIYLTPEQVKGRIKSLAMKNNCDARVLIRIFMMEHFLERVANSKYKDNFIIKGGMLITSMVGVSLRSTMDIDTSIKNIDLSKDNIRKIVNEIKDVDLEDDVNYEIKDISNIMDDREYQGIRISMMAMMEKLVVPIKIDFSTGDIITPKEIEYHYKLLLEDRTINICSYNLETILAEKLQTILARGTLNTRMRDYYDIHILLSIYKYKLDVNVLKEAFEETCKSRETEDLIQDSANIFNVISNDKFLQNLWERYQEKYSYSREIGYKDVIGSVKNILEIILNKDLEFKLYNENAEEPPTPHRGMHR